MMKTSQAIETKRALLARNGRIRGGQRWTPYVAVAWSLIYGGLGIYWAVGGRGFPYTSETVSSGMVPQLGQFGPVAAWIFVLLAFSTSIGWRSIATNCVMIELTSRPLPMPGELMVVMNGSSDGDRRAS